MSFARRFFCIFLAVLLLGNLSACTGQNAMLDPNNPVQITIWHYYNGSQLTAFDNMVRQFNQTVGKESGIQVESFSQGGVNDLAQLVLDTAAGTVGDVALPDIFAAYADTAYELKELGLTADLDQHLSDNEISQYIESFWEEGRLPPDDISTIFPMAKATEILFMDTLSWNDFLSQPEIQNTVTDANLETWEGILAAAEAYYQYTDNLTPDIDGDGKAMFGIDSMANFIYTTLRQQGITLLSNQNGEGVMHLDEAAFHRTFALYYEAVVRGWFSQAGRYRSDAVTTGEIIGFIGASTGSIYFPDLITLEDGTQREAQLAAYPMPTFTNGQKVAIQQGAGMVVTKSDAQREYASVVFLKWLTEEEQNLQFSLDAAYLPVKRDVLYGERIQSLLSEMQSSPDVGTHNSAVVFNVVLGQLETHESYYTQPFPGLLYVRQALDGLEGFAQSGRDEVLELMDQGASYRDAVRSVLDKDAYGDWITYICESTAPYLS